MGKLLGQQRVPLGLWAPSRPPMDERTVTTIYENQKVWFENVVSFTLLKCIERVTSLGAVCLF